MPEHDMPSRVVNCVKTRVHLHVVQHKNRIFHPDDLAFWLTILTFEHIWDIIKVNPWAKFCVYTDRINFIPSNADTGGNTSKVLNFTALNFINQWIHLKRMGPNDYQNWDAFEFGGFTGLIYSRLCIISEPIQSRCAVLRYSKLSDAQILSRLQKVLEKEDVSYADDGIEAIIFTAQGDMRQVIL